MATMTTTTQPRSHDSMRMRRPPTTGETLVPRGFEKVAHPLFLLLRGPPPPDKRPLKMNFAPFEAGDGALLSAVTLGASPPQEVAQQNQPQTPQLHAAYLKTKLLTYKTINSNITAGENEDIDLSCAVCLEEHTVPVVVVTSDCTHIFCKKCITCWLSINHSSSHDQGPSCPLCKRPVTWLLSLSSSSPPTPPFRFVLLAVGPDAELLERQPWPSPALLQVSRQKLLDLFEARERRHQQRCQQQQQQQQQVKESKGEDASKKSGKRRGYEPGVGVQQGRPLTESLQDELRRVNAEITLLKTKKKR